MSAMQRDTRKILRMGAGVLLTGVLSALAMLFLFGGVTRQGPHTNGGWLSLIIAIGCLPSGTMMLALGAAKWLGDRKR